MPLPPDFKIRSGRYVNDTTKEVRYACNCPGTKLSLTRLAAERGQWSVWPGVAAKAAQTQPAQPSTVKAAP